MHSVIFHQNNQNNINLLKASASAYREAKEGEIAITIIYIFLSLAYPVGFLYIQDDQLKLMLFVISFTVSIIILILTPLLEGSTLKGAIFKEMFDLALYDIRKKHTIDFFDENDLDKYVKNYKGKMIQNWYSNNLSANIPTDKAILVLQKTNTLWDINIRRTYKNYIFFFLITYIVILSAILIYYHVKLLTVFLLLFSLLSFFTFFYNTARGHLLTIKRRFLVSTLIEKEIKNPITTNENILRDFQDEIFLARLASCKIPDFFSRFYYNKMNRLIENYVNEVNTKFDNPLS